ncbi:MAG TPA: hypothetical protein VFL80_10320 [Thermoanaerobaculia bacterium]|nr:hypothetical protein [Thermoanaerobaculia bacterium]
MLRSTHTGAVPQDPAYVIMNHWGTHNQSFGGPATPNVARYLYVDWFQFTPATGS